MVILALVFLLFGGIAVKRAEIPKRVHVARLQYASPVEIDTAEDRQADYHSSEFNGFRRQAWAVVVEGQNPYDPENFHVRAYPPFFNVFFMPFAVFWKWRGVGSALFYVIGFALMLATAWALSRCRAAGDGDFGVFALMCALLIPGALNVLVRCETDLFILGPLALALLWLTREKRPFRAGLLLGFAASLKVLPGLFVVYLICRRQWRALSGMVAMGVFCTVVLPALVMGPQRTWNLHAEWVRAVVTPYHSEGAEAVVGASARVSNQSLAAALKRFLTPEKVKISRKAEPRAYNVANWRPGSVRVLTKTVQLLIALGLATVWILRKRGAPPRSEEMLFAAVAPGILLLSDVSLTTHHVLLMIPMALVILRALEDNRSAAWLWVLAIYLLATVGGTTHAIRPFTPLLPLTLCLLAACFVLSRMDRAVSRPSEESQRQAG